MQIKKINYRVFHMTLTAHGVIGAAAASVFPAQFYGLAWLASFLSHFFSDAIPHWDYQTYSLKKDLNPLNSDFIITTKSLVDFVKIGFDLSLGLALGYFLFPAPLYNPWLILGGAFFGILPDPLQFAYWKIRRQPLTFLQRCHVGIHAKRHLEAWPFGLLFQMAVLLAILLLAFFLHSLFLGFSIYI